MGDISTFTQAEKDQINEQFQELLNEYLKSNHRKKVDLITTAFNFANHAHGGIRRRSGEPYILHPLGRSQNLLHGDWLGFHLHLLRTCCTMWSKTPNTR